MAASFSIRDSASQPSANGLSTTSCASPTHQSKPSSSQNTIRTRHSKKPNTSRSTWKSLIERSANSSPAVDEVITKLNQATVRRIAIARARERTDPALQLDTDFETLKRERALYDAQESLQTLQLTLVLEYEQRKRTEKFSRIFDRTKLAESQVHLDLATCLIGNTADRARDAMDVLSPLCSNPNTRVEESLVKQGMPGETVANLFACIDTRRRKDGMDQVAKSRGAATVMSR